MMANQPLEGLRWQDLEIEPENGQVGHCDCCGSATSRVWGFVHYEQSTLASYFVGWTVGRKDHGARFDLIVGPWGEQTTAADRVSVALEYWRTIDRQGFRIIPGRNFEALAGKALDRGDVIATPLADRVFAMADAIFIKDGRLEDVRGWA